MTKVAVITGAASGIGKRAAERLLGQGWSVWAFDVSLQALEEFKNAAGGGSRLHISECDVGSPASVSAAFAKVAAETDSVDALICSAGVIRIGALEQLTPEDVDLVMGVNLKGPWLTVREALPLLRKDANVADPKRVIIIGSIGGIRPKVGTGIYAATKAAIHVIAGIYAVELAPSGITVNVIAPGTIDTPMVKSLAGANPSSRYKPSGESPLGRIGQPDDVADVIDFFLSDAAKYVNGTVLPIDGGTRAAFVKT
ncbi:MAG: SDR family NAD(P)-dependent oxidoreductase [Hyphomicrobiaceae bacterium]